MCGIYLALSKRAHVSPSERAREIICRRGPDSSRELQAELEISGHKAYVTAFSTVLALRGDHTVPQPITARGEPKNGFLCWNGEAWSIAGKAVSGNDSEAVFSLLSSSHAAIAEDFAAIYGPFAFVYYDHASLRLYYGRDPLGRRSLMHRFDSEGNFYIASICDASEPGWLEVEADGIYCIDLAQYLQAKADDQPPSPERISYNQSKLQLLQGATGVPGSEQDSKNGSCSVPLTDSSPPVDRLHSLIHQALVLRVSGIPQYGDPNVPHLQVPSKLAVLFSGGLDCTVLARLSHDILASDEPIDLINVAFQNPRVHRPPKDAVPADYSPYELCPDRITGRASYAELQRVCPSRTWRFVAVNVPYEDFIAHRQEVISLIYPHNTEMDLSIASALYFAARGSGVMTQGDGPAVQYTTDARVLLSGLGADELFGGYTRHATAYSRHGLAGLLDELNLDVGRLGKRNLGRDDRVLSHWARETRFPFLDEELVNWAVHAPVWERCGFGEALPPVEPAHQSSLYLDPAKKLLRCLAWKLGMKQVANEKKRAIQFGARTAKMEVGRTKGTQLLS